MYPRVMTIIALLAALILIAACEGEPTPSPYTGYLTEEIPPCTPIAGSSVDPCEPGSSELTGGGFAGASEDLGEKPQNVASSLTLDFVTAFVPHVVLRGTYIPGTVRCTSEIPYRLPSYVSSDESMGWEVNSFQISCYADVRVNGYIMGSGPPQLTALVWFYTYWRGDYTEDADSAEVKENIERLRKHYETLIPRDGIYGVGNVKGTGGTEPGGVAGREMILFIGPTFDHSSEAWQVYETWDVQRREDGTVVAVHPHRDAWKELRPDEYREHLSVLEVELPGLKQEVTAAHQTRVSEYGGRIGADTNLPLLISDVHGLDEFMTNTGAYDHPEGTPLPPPPVPGEGDPVPNIGVDDSTPESTPAGPGEDSTSTPAAVP